MRLPFLAATALAALLHGNAHAAMVEVAGRKWNCDDGVSVTSAVATVSTVGSATKSVFLTTHIDVSPYLESGIEWQLRVRGRGIKPPAKSYLGVKAMLIYDEPGGDRRYPGPIGRTGDFDWITVRYRTAFRTGVRGNTAKLVLGLQETEGEVEYDLSSLRIAAATTPREQIDETRKCRYTPRVADMSQLRGVMSPSRPMTEDDFIKLHGWSVKLLRYQMNRFWNLHYANRDLKDYDKWLNSKLDHLDSTVLPLAAKYGIKVAIDLHMPPGGKASDGEMNMFYEPKYAKHFVECWQKIASRFNAHPSLYGYDILNEPSQTYNPADGMGWWGLQKKAAEAIRAIDPTTPIIVEANHADSPDGFEEMPVLDIEDVIYEVHLYAPMDFTHQGVRKGHAHVPTRWPDTTKGWNRTYLKQKLQKVREFQLRHNAKIFLGEFSAIAWAEGAEKWMDDAISIFNEYGWDWTYHAYGEFEGWSVEHSAERPYEFRQDKTTPRKTALLKGLNDDVHSSSVPFTLEWKDGEPAPVKVLDFGPDGVGGYPSIEVEPIDGKPRLRLSYGCVPSFGDGGDFSRATSARYLGPTVDLPILPASVDRFDVFSVSTAGVYAATLQQGLVRYVRVRLEKPGTAAKITAVRFENRGTHSVEPAVGSFACSDKALTDLWRASVRTCTLAAIPERTEPLRITTPLTNVVLGAAHAFLADGAKRDRLVWSGDLWWAQFNMYAAFAPESPFMPGSLRMLAENQTPEGYIQACPYPESHGPLAAADYGPFQSDEFAAWFVPVLASHHLYTGDIGIVKKLYPNVSKLAEYLLSHINADGVFEQRPETSKHANDLAFGTKSTHHRSYMNVLLWRTFLDAEFLADVTGMPDDAARWRDASERSCAAVRERFMRKDGLLASSLEDASIGAEANALALSLGFFSKGEAEKALAALGRISHGKFQLLLVRGAFAYGMPDEAVRRIREHNWLKAVSPEWKGVHATSECMNHPTRASWGDEAHPDTALAGDLTYGILGVRPLAPGYSHFEFMPGAANGIEWAKGTVPTPSGPIHAEWRIENGKLSQRLSAPPDLTQIK
jgi:hypothetical protein